MNEVHVTVEVEVNPTEDPEKVKQAVENLVWKPRFELLPKKRKSLLIARAEGRDGLTKIYGLLRQERILDAARKVMREGLTGNAVTFYVNKQVAYVKHLSFCKPAAESPLGPIKIKIICDDPIGLIDWLAPRTIEGRPKA